MRELTHWQEWTVVDLIGRGSFGAVYEIERKIFGESEKAALKVISIPQNEAEVKTLRSEGYDDESITMVFNDQLQGILKEYMLMRKLNGNTNVVNCDDVQRVQHDDGMGWDIFIKMELLQPMAESLPRTVTDQQVAKIGADICNALILCSRFNIIHRDIKPQNIFVSPYGDYKLGDFGVARTMERTAGGTKIGTYNYMAPEVYNNQDYNHTVDIYSLGLVLYWLLNERRIPFLPLPPAFPKASDQETARYRRFRGDAIPAPKHGSEELKAIVLKACAFDPKNRYQSAAEMKQALEALGKAEEKITEIVPVFDMFAEDDATMGGAWSPVHRTPPVTESVPAVEPIISAEPIAVDEPVLENENIEIPTENEDKTVGMWAAIEAERDRKRKEAEEAERRRIEAERKRLAEEAAEKERQRLLEEQRIRDEKAAELKRQKNLEEKSEVDNQSGNVKKKGKSWLVALIAACLLISAFFGFFVTKDANGDNVSDDDVSDKNVEFVNKDYKINIKFSNVFQPEEMNGQASEMLARMITERTNGAVTVTYYGQNQLDCYGDSVAQAVNGANWMGLEEPSLFANYVGDCAVLIGPMLYASNEEYNYVMDSDIVVEIKDRLAEEHNIKILDTHYSFGFRSVFTNKVITEPKDLKGMTLRATSSALFSKTLKCLGATPKTMGFTEAISGMEKGTVKGYEGSISTHKDTGTYQFIHNVALTNHLISTRWLFMSNNVWEQIPAEYQKVILECAEECGVWEQNAVAESEAEMISFLEDHGTVFNEVDLDAFTVACEPVFDWIVDEYNADPKLHTKIIALVQEYRKNNN